MASDAHIGRRCAPWLVRHVVAERRPCRAGNCQESCPSLTVRRTSSTRSSCTTMAASTSHGSSAVCRVMSSPTTGRKSQFLLASATRQGGSVSSSVPTTVPFDLRVESIDEVLEEVELWLRTQLDRGTGAQAPVARCSYESGHVGTDGAVQAAEDWKSGLERDQVCGCVGGCRAASVVSGGCLASTGQCCDVAGRRDRNRHAGWRRRSRSTFRGADGLFARGGAGGT